jgi:hypothetical protein
VTARAEPDPSHVVVEPEGGVQVIDATGRGGRVGVGFGVGLGVGFGVGTGVGAGVGTGVGRAVGRGVGFGVGFGVATADGSGLADALGVASSVADAVAVPLLCATATYGADSAALGPVLAPGRDWSANTANTTTPTARTVITDPKAANRAGQTGDRLR